MRHLHVLLSDEEFDQLKKQAEMTGLSTSVYVRSLMKGTVLKVRPPEIYTSLLRQLSGMGNNINQIARMANTTGAVRQEDIDYIKQMQSDLWDKIKSL